MRNIVQTNSFMLMPAPAHPIQGMTSARKRASKQLRPRNYRGMSFHRSLSSYRNNNIAQGLTVLAWRPKAGKSWLGLGIAVTVATGEPALGSIEVETGDVLYLALEDNRRRLQRRLNQLLPGSEKPERLHLATFCPRLDEGGLEAIDRWCRTVPNARLVVIDVLNKVRSQRGSTNCCMTPTTGRSPRLKGLADELDIAIVVVHHTNKREDVSDPFDGVSGTTGLTGAADTVLDSRQIDGIKRGSHGRGRDISGDRGRIEVRAPYRALDPPRRSIKSPNHR